MLFYLVHRVAFQSSWTEHPPCPSIVHLGNCNCVTDRHLILRDHSIPSPLQAPHLNMALAPPWSPVHPLESLHFRERKRNPGRIHWPAISKHSKAAKPAILLKELYANAMTLDKISTGLLMRYTQAFFCTSLFALHGGFVTLPFRTSPSYREMLCLRPCAQPTSARIYHGKKVKGDHH